MFDRLKRLIGFEQKSTLTSPSPELLALLGAGGTTAAGVNVGPSSALTVPAVACAVRAISEAAATLDPATLPALFMLEDDDDWRSESVWARLNPGMAHGYAQPVMAPLLDDGLPVQTLQLGWVTQSPALAEIERAVLQGKFRHGGHPGLRWCFDNVAIHTDQAGNRTMHKGKSTGRIDGAFAAWMAVSLAASEGGGSIYDSDQWTPDMMVM